MILRLAFAGALAASAAAATGATQAPKVGGAPSLLAPSMDGRDIYRYYCASCHGLDGAGDGPVASALKTRPADLTRLAIRNGGTFPRERVQRFVTNGDGDSPAHGTRDMPVWGPTFRSFEAADQMVAMRIANVIKHLESLQAK